MLPMIIAPYKRDLLYRKAQGNSLRERYKEKLNFLLGTAPQDALFLSLIETDEIIKNLLERKKILTENAECYLLLDGDWRYCGAYLCRNFNFNPEFDFNKFQSDEIRLISTDFVTEIAIDYSETYSETLIEFRISKYAPVKIAG
jgi:hypothetical protein